LASGMTKDSNSLIILSLPAFLFPLFCDMECFSMARINTNYNKLAAGYLFPEIARRTNAFLEQNPGAQVLRLGIGDTTEPIVPAVLNGLNEGVSLFGKEETYSGYGPSEGVLPLREGLAGLYAEMGVSIDPTEFLSRMGRSLTPLIFRASFRPIVWSRCRTPPILSMWTAM
jgi:hypothetical protein